jgi:hypothetical protein
MAAAREHYARRGCTGQQLYGNGNMALLSPAGAARVELWKSVDGKVRAGRVGVRVIHTEPIHAPRMPLPPRVTAVGHRRPVDFTRALLAILVAPVWLAYAACVIALGIAVAGAVAYGVVWVLHALWRAS